MMKSSKTIVGTAHQNENLIEVRVYRDGPEDISICFKHSNIS